MPTEKGLVVRDEKGLTLAERRLLQEIALTGSWSEAAENLGFTKRQVANLLKNDAFKHEYDALFSTEDLKIVKRELEMVTGKTGSVFEEALDAEMVKRVPVKCPHCGHGWSIMVTVMDWAAKLRAGETLLKIANILKDTKSVKHEGTVGVVHLDIYDQLALEAYRRGRPIPPQYLDKLRRAGVLDGNELPAAVESQYTVVNQDDIVIPGEGEIADDD